MRDESRLAQLAAAILDGTPVDWAAAESEPQGTQPSQLKHLKAIAALADVHRSDAVPAFGCWGHLRLLERIGRGAFGEVYRAWDTRLDREVALKLMPAGRASVPGAASSIIHEGRLLARVRHPNVVTIYGAEQIDDRIGLWMEFVRGGTLEQVLEEKGVFSAADATRVGVEICRAVSAVHGAGLLHRDIKAHNVMLADDGRVVLMDFGTGRELEDGSSVDLAGTPLYLAPEILRGQIATVQSDIYSLAVLLFHLISGSYPVQAATTQELRRAHERNERVDLQSVRPETPSSLARIIERAIDPLADGRYENADALMSDLVSLTRRSGRRSVLYAAAAAATIIVVSWLALTVAGRQPVNATLTAKAPVIAVLPFENLSKEAGSEEFADGLTYEIHRNLAAIEGLELRSATSSFTFKDKQRDLADIDKQLDVDYVLEGSILISASKMRVSPRLVRVAGDTIVWANTFDREIKEVFAIQDEISLAIVNALRLRLGRGQRRYETAPNVYYEFLKARGLRSMRHPDNAFKAAAIFEAIVARDPAFAPAWAGLASAAADATRHQPREQMPPVDPRMEPAAVTALRIDPLLAEAHAAMGSVYARNRDWANAQKSFLEALDLNPSLTTTHTDYVLSTLLPMGKVTDALHVLETAQRIDPLSLDVRRVLALVQVDAERYNEAIESSRWVLARDPKFPYADLWLSRALIFVGRPNEALPLLENRSSEGNWGYLGYLYAVTGRRDEAETLAAKLAGSPSWQMLIYGGLGDKERAFEALERTAAVNWLRAATWMLHPEMAVLRGDPRLNDLRKKLGVPPLENER
jgi:TolB-like protein